MIRFRCFACGKEMTVKDSSAGRREHCKGCGQPVTAPEVTPGNDAKDDATIIRELDALFQSLSDNDQQKLIGSRITASDIIMNFISWPGAKLKMLLAKASRVVGYELYPNVIQRPVPLRRIWGIIVGIAVLLHIRVALSDDPLLSFAPLQFINLLVIGLIPVYRGAVIILQRDYRDILILGLTGHRTVTESHSYGGRHATTTKFMRLSNEERLEHFKYVRAAGAHWAVGAQQAYHKRAIAKAMFAPMLLCFLFTTASMIYYLIAIVPA